MSGRERWVGRVVFYLLWTVGALVLFVEASGAPSGAGRHVARQDEIPSTAVLIPSVDYYASTTTTSAPPPSTSTTVRVTTTTTARVNRGTPRTHVIVGGPTAEQWAALRLCESGGNYANKSNRLYRGGYQFSYETWASVGGLGDPADAAPAEQDMRAGMLYARSGAGQWPRCGRFLS